MRNNSITILDDDCETITPSPNNTTLTLTNTDESSDCAVVPSPTTHSSITPSTSKPIKINPNKSNYEALRPLFGWLPVDTIKKTFQLTTQYARIPMSAILKKHYKSLFPAMNVTRRDEPVVTDTIYSDTPAIDNGCKQAHISVGTKTTYTDIYDMKTDSQFVNTLEDYIRHRGVMSQLISDSAQVEVGKRVLDISRALCIGNWQVKPINNTKIQLNKDTRQSNV